MKHFKSILCPYDFSEFSDEALAYAVKLADADTQITLFNIIELPYLVDPNGFNYYDHKAEEIKEHSEAAMSKKMEEVYQKYPNHQFDIALAVDKDPAVLIIEKQQKDQYELVVMGSHGRKGLERLLMGSVAESVLRGADCPVIIIKHK